jgi:hypothetical protein
VCFQKQCSTNFNLLFVRGCGQLRDQRQAEVCQTVVEEKKNSTADHIVRPDRIALLLAEKFLPLELLAGSTVFFFGQTVPARRRPSLCLGVFDAKN